jgi:hypothetical protein
MNWRRGSEMGEEDNNIEIKEKEEDDGEKNQNKNPFKKDKEKEINILDLFKGEYTETSSGACKMECPDCLLQGGRTLGFMLFPDTNSAYCHSSGKHFTMLEAYALKKKIIRCLDGRETGEGINRKILGGELFTLTLDEFKNEFGTDMYNKLNSDLNIRKSIELPGNNKLQSTFCDELGDVYKSRNILFFRGESRDVVEIGRIKKVNSKNEQYTETGFISMNNNRFVTLVEMFISPWTTIFTKSGQAMTVGKSMNGATASIVLSSPNFQNKIPLIVRIFGIQIPIIYDGELTFPKKGYDVRFGSWLPYNAPQIKEDELTVEQAKLIIDKIFEEFCFASEKDRTHAIAGFITPFMRGLFPKFCTRTPVFAYMANRERAGKDYCAGITGIVYEGTRTEEPPISNDEKNSSNDEIRKKIMACMMQGKKRFHSSNNKGLINNAVFESVTTSETWSDRILGKTQVVEFDNEIDYTISANAGTKLTPDLANRSRVINLHLVQEDANARTFKNPNLHEWVKDNRTLIVSALYTLVKNWFNNGSPPGSEPFTSFPHWAKIVGGIMEAAGYDSPCKSDKSALISLDGETQEMKQLFEACFDKAPNTSLSKDDIKEIIKNEDIMQYFDFTNKSDQTKFGMRIDRFSNRMLSEITMTCENLEQRASRRRFIFTKKIDDKIDGDGKVGNVTSEGLKPQDLLKSQDLLIKNEKTKPQDLLKSSKLLIKDEKIWQHGHLLQPLPNPPQSLIEEYSDTSNVAKPCHVAKSDIMLKNETSLQQFSENFNKSVAKKETKIKEKTDRELQFFESPECSDIVEQCTKEQTLEWIKNNPGKSFETFYNELGIGSFKHVDNLVSTGLVKPLGDGWEETKNEQSRHSTS